uniref:Transmembrane protein n=1 Tax=Pseudomonas aeruginosa TaxID=287 RepID=A0A6C0L359_PSEAI|nr:hypothetical protein [Pseudomonas aeruginosa]
MMFENLPYLGAWTSAIHGMIFTGMCITGLACCVSLSIKSALVVTSVLSKIESRRNTATNRR